MPVGFRSGFRLHADVDDHLVTDDELLLLLQDGAGPAFVILCRRYERRLLRVAMRVLRNEADAEDVVQEALMSVFTHIAGFRGEAGLYTWLVRIVMNTSLMFLRKRSRRVVVSLEHGIQENEPWIERLRQPGEDAEGEAIEREHSALLQEAIQRLPVSYRALVSEWITGEASATELAAKSALSVPATKSRLLRGRQHLEVVLRSKLRPRGVAAR